MSRHVTRTSALALAIRESRKIIWSDDHGWHAALSLANTPRFAKEVIDVFTNQPAAGWKIGEGIIPISPKEES